MRQCGVGLEPLAAATGCSPRRPPPPSSRSQTDAQAKRRMKEAYGYRREETGR